MVELDPERIAALSQEPPHVVEPESSSQTGVEAEARLALGILTILPGEAQRLPETEGSAATSDVNR